MNPREEHEPPRGTRSIDEAPAWMRNSKAFKDSVREYEGRYGPAETLIPVTLPKGSSKVVVDVGEAAQYTYIAADEPGGELIAWEHESGDNGEGESPTEPQRIVYDTKQKMVLIGYPKGSRARFGPRGISG